MAKDKKMERRKSPRVKGSFAIEIAHHKTKIIADTINISSSGIYCQTDSSIPLFREINITIKLPGSADVVKCSGVIVRCEKIPGRERYNLAIFLSDITHKNKEYLSEYIEKELARVI